MAQRATKTTRKSGARSKRDAPPAPLPPSLTAGTRQGGVDLGKILQSRHAQIVWTPVSRIRRYTTNPRKKQPVALVAQSIVAFGFNQPIVVDQDHEIIAGDTRFLASLQLQLEEVPVIVASWLTEAEVIAYRIADNRAAEEAEWDYERLQAQFAKLDELHYDPTLTGFSLEAIKVAGDLAQAARFDAHALAAAPAAQLSDGTQGETAAAGELVIFSCPMTVEERNAVFMAILHAKKSFALPQSGPALARLCSDFTATAAKAGAA